MNLCRSITRAALVAAAGIAVAAGVSAGRLALAAPETAAIVNRGVVELETGPADDVSVRMAAEIASIIDDGATRRVVPVVGKGPLQNLVDLKYLRGIDLAIVQADALDYAKSQNFLPGVAALTYVTRLYNEEFHLLARPDIKSVKDLAGQTVNVDVKGSGTAVTASRLFGLLGINAKFATDRQAVALQKLRQGEIAALAYVAAEPAPFFQALKAGTGLHLLAIPLVQAVTAVYAPTRITAADYPNLVSPDGPIDTIAVGNVLMAADLRGLPQRDRNLSNFIDTFFTGFQGLLAPGYDAKWREVNIAADLPGWTRTPAAAEWLRDNPQVAAMPNLAALKTLFSRFIDERRQASGGAPMSPADKAALFQQFESWQRGQAR
ncbi:MAG TPA: TAXI family TRAP transporter solute-binding subunit [Stellaceae bacterium]|nr:TAXI family TRAP transporter solute-binding subunit [Stellaceae bacterium]